jgi:S1-C subfamily serine protease
LIKGDIIIQLDAQKISSYAELNGYISTKRPNDKVQVTFIRNEKTITVTVILSKSDVFSTQFKGLDLENINATDKKKFRIDYGVKIKDVNNERLNAYANDLKGGIILSIGNIKAIDVESVSKALSNLDENQSIQIEMLTVNGQVIRLIL